MVLVGVVLLMVVELVEFSLLLVMESAVVVVAVFVAVVVVVVFVVVAVFVVVMVVMLVPMACEVGMRSLTASDSRKCTMLTLCCDWSRNVVK